MVSGSKTLTASTRRTTMAQKSWYTRQIEAEKARIAQMVACYASMTERELIGVLGEIERDDWEMRHNANVSQTTWAWIATRNGLVRAELASRRDPVVELAVAS